MSRKPIYKSLYAQVIFAIVLGVLLGHFWPQTGEAMKPFGDAFIKLIKMIIAPIIFCTVVVGIAGMEDMKKVGKTGGLALLYFEVVSTLALIIGLVIINVLQPGHGMNVDPASLEDDGAPVAAGLSSPPLQATTAVAETVRLKAAPRVRVESRRSVMSNTSLGAAGPSA